MPPVSSGSSPIRAIARISGLPPTYVALRLMGAVEGELAGYAQCPADDEGTSVVSICGMVFG